MPVIPGLIALFIVGLFLILAVTVTWYIILPITLLWLLWSGIQTLIRLTRNAASDTNGCHLRRSDSFPKRRNTAPIIDVDYTEVP